MSEQKSYSERIKEYTLAELEEALGTVDVEKFPDRYSLIKVEIEDRKLHGDPPHILAINKYQTFDRRFFAGLIDGLILLPLDLIGKFIIKSSLPAGIVVVLYEISCWVMIVYSVVMHGLYGQTIGKKICKVKVFDISEKAITFKQAVLRDIGPIIIQTISSIYSLTHASLVVQFLSNDSELVMPGPYSIIGYFGFAWFLVELLTMFTNKKRRALHDFIAGTVVCRTS